MPTLGVRQKREWNWKICIVYSGQVLQHCLEVFQILRASFNVFNYSNSKFSITYAKRQNILKSNGKILIEDLTNDKEHRRVVSFILRSLIYFYFFNEFIDFL